MGNPEDEVKNTEEAAPQPEVELSTPPITPVAPIQDLPPAPKPDETVIAGN